MKTAIFLDVDGVLNCISTKDRCNGFRGIDDSKVELLKQIQTLMDGDIVLTSTWRMESKKSTWWKYLTEKLEKHGLRVSGETPQLDGNRYLTKGKEVDTWLKKNPYRRVVILDDMDFRWKKYGLDKNFIQTSDVNGLSEEHVRLIKDNPNRYIYQERTDG